MMDQPLPFPTNHLLGEPWVWPTTERSAAVLATARRRAEQWHEDALARRPAKTAVTLLDRFDPDSYFDRTTSPWDVTLAEDHMYISDRGKCCCGHQHDAGHHAVHVTTVATHRRCGYCGTIVGIRQPHCQVISTGEEVGADGSFVKHNTSRKARQHGRYWDGRALAVVDSGDGHNVNSMRFGCPWCPPLKQRTNGWSYSGFKTHPGIYHKRWFTPEVGMYLGKVIEALKGDVRSGHVPTHHTWEYEIPEYLTQFFPGRPAQVRATQVVPEPDIPVAEPAVATAVDITPSPMETVSTTSPEQQPTTYYSLPSRDDVLALVKLYDEILDGLPYGFARSFKDRLDSITENLIDALDLLAGKEELA